jgi:hypothetical protein
MGSRRADLDQLLEEADRALNADGEHVGSEDDDEGEVDALEQMARILKKNPVPAWTKLQKIVGPGDSNSFFRRRAVELTRIHAASKEAARPRILKGAALIIVNSCAGLGDGYSTWQQFEMDMIVLEKVLPFLGFEYVQVKRNLSRAKVPTRVLRHCAASCCVFVLPRCSLWV